MLTVKDFKNKVLISYYRKNDKFDAKVVYNVTDESGDTYRIPKAVLNYTRGEIKGIVVAIGPGILGWSLCRTGSSYDPIFREIHSGDKFDKKIGLHIALERARIAQSLSHTDRVNFYEKLPSSLEKDFAKMMDRSYTYFSNDDEDAQW